MVVCPKNKDIPFQLTLLLAPFQPIFWWSSLSLLQYRIVPDLVNDLEVFASEFSHKSTHSLEVNPYFFSGSSLRGALHVIIKGKNYSSSSTSKPLCQDGFKVSRQRRCFSFKVTLCEQACHL